MSTYDFNVEYQSELSRKLLVELLDKGVCSLPTYDEARHTHENFLKAMLEKYNEINTLKSTILPIT